MLFITSRLAHRAFGNILVEFLCVSRTHSLIVFEVLKLQNSYLFLLRQIILWWNLMNGLASLFLEPKGRGVNSSFLVNILCRSIFCASLFATFAFAVAVLLLIKIFAFSSFLTSYVRWRDGFAQETLVLFPHKASYDNVLWDEWCMRVPRAFSFVETTCRNFHSFYLLFSTFVKLLEECAYWGWKLSRWNKLTTYIW